MPSLNANEAKLGGDNQHLRLGGYVVSKFYDCDDLRYIVRRLTPVECERLMGYPDGYTIPTFDKITDALVEEFIKVFKAFAEITGIGQGLVTKPQVRKWLERISDPEACPDPPRYKACGNGWAINCARWVLQGIDRYLFDFDNRNELF